MADCTWQELVLGTTCLQTPVIAHVIEDLWPKIVFALGESRDVEVCGPMQKAWFHVRRATYTDTRNCFADRTVGRVDILRLQRGWLSDRQEEDIRLLAGVHIPIACAGWNPWKPDDRRHDNAFLSFLQKLSLLRSRDGICYKKFLGCTPQSGYDKDTQCQEAWKVMTYPNSKWYNALVPWFDHMRQQQMDVSRTYEYAHWFGHILTGWSANA